MAVGFACKADVGAGVVAGPIDALIPQLSPVETDVAIAQSAGQPQPVATLQVVLQLVNLFLTKPSCKERHLACSL